MVMVREGRLKPVVEGWRRFLGCCEIMKGGKCGENGEATRASDSLIGCS